MSNVDITEAFRELPIDPSPGAHGRRIQAGVTRRSKAISELIRTARKAGIKASLTGIKRRSAMHIAFETRALSIWTKVAVHKNKTQIGHTFREAQAWSKLVALPGEGSPIPVVFHKLQDQPFNAVLEAGDFLTILRLADERAVQILEAQEVGDVVSAMDAESEKEDGGDRLGSNDVVLANP